MVRPYVRLALLCAITLVALTPPRLSASTPGPIAIAMAQSPDATILRADGRLILFDTTRAKKPQGVFQVPSDYVASDVAIASTANGLVRCLLINSRKANSYGSFLLQLVPGDKKETQVWTYLPQRGVYIGVAVDADAKYAYVTNSTSNSIHRVVIGNDKAPVEQVASLHDAEVLGAVAVDQAGSRLFAADMTGGHIYVVPLRSSGPVRALGVGYASEIRAMVWHPSARRLLFADAGQESVWSINPDRNEDPLEVVHRSFKQPSGLTIAADDSVWGVDQESRTVFQILIGQRTPAQVMGLD